MAKGINRNYQDIGVKRVINLVGNGTRFGGSLISPSIQAAMDEANDYFVVMEELLEKSGQAIADILGVEAALVTSGCFAGMVLGAAGIMTGKDPEKISCLPDTTGMRNEFIFQKNTMYTYAHAPDVAGGKMVMVGDSKGTTVGQIEAAIGDRTAAISYLGGVEGQPGVVPLQQVIDIAQRHRVAVLLDSAYEVYPLEKMCDRANSGAELVCFGGKYVGAPHSTGFICGKKDFVEAARLNNFIDHDLNQNTNLGRGYKVDRQEVMAVVAAIKEWFTMNHEDRYGEEEKKIQSIINGLDDLPYIKSELDWIGNGRNLHLKITIDEQALGQNGIDISEQMKKGDPAIHLIAENNTLTLLVHLLKDDQVQEVIDILRLHLSIYNK